MGHRNYRPLKYIYILALCPSFSCPISCSLIRKLIISCTSFSSTPPYVLALERIDCPEVKDYARNGQVYILRCRLGQQVDVTKCKNYYAAAMCG